MLEEVIYCCRDGVTTRCDVYLSYTHLVQAVGSANIPEYISSLNSNMNYPQSVRWGVDTESLNTNIKRFYVGVEYQDEDNPNLQGRGYKFNSNNELIEYNEYVVADEVNIAVNKYHANGSIIVAGGFEAEVTDDDWTGNNSILETVKETGNAYHILKKSYANQSYLRWLPNEAATANTG